jgi:GAF domain-containing protein
MSITSIVIGCGQVQAKGYLSNEVFKRLGQSAKMLRSELGKPDIIKETDESIHWVYDRDHGEVYSFARNVDAVEFAAYVVAGLTQYEALRTKTAMIEELEENGFKYFSGDEETIQYRKNGRSFSITHRPNIHGKWNVTLQAGLQY